MARSSEGAAFEEILDDDDRALTARLREWHVSELIETERAAARLIAACQLERQRRAAQ
jgi:hypothetical protein